MLGLRMESSSNAMGPVPLPISGRVVSEKMHVLQHSLSSSVLGDASLHNTEFLEFFFLFPAPGQESARTPLRHPKTMVFIIFYYNMF